jgi:hypothetical protein
MEITIRLNRITMTIIVTPRPFRANWRCQDVSQPALHNVSSLFTKLIPSYGLIGQKAANYFQLVLETALTDEQQEPVRDEGPGFDPSSLPGPPTRRTSTARRAGGFC